MSLARLAAAALTLTILLVPAALAERFVDRAEVKMPPPEGQPVILVHAFGTENTDFGTGSKNKNKPKYQELARQMERSAPTALVEALVAELEERSILGGARRASDVDEAPEGALHLRGEFTMLNPGSRGKRAWVGFGAGKSKVCVEGELVGPDGQVHLTFTHCRSGSGHWTFAGGRSEGLMFNDLAAASEKIAKFLHAWALGALPAS